MKFLKQVVYTLLWILHDKSAAYKPRSNLPQHEIEAIVHAFYPAVVVFFESEEGKLLLKKWGIEGDYVGIGHCILGYGDCEYPTPKERKANYIYRV